MYISWLTRLFSVKLDPCRDISKYEFRSNRLLAFLPVLQNKHGKVSHPNISTINILLEKIAENQPSLFPVIFDFFTSCQTCFSAYIGNCPSFSLIENFSTYLHRDFFTPHILTFLFDNFSLCRDIFLDDIIVAELYPIIFDCLSSSSEPKILSSISSFLYTSSLQGSSIFYVSSFFDVAFSRSLNYFLSILEKFLLEFLTDNQSPCEIIQSKVYSLLKKVNYSELICSCTTSLSFCCLKLLFINNLFSLAELTQISGELINCYKILTENFTLTGDHHYSRFGRLIFKTNYKLLSNVDYSNFNFLSLLNSFDPRNLESFILFIEFLIQNRDYERLSDFLALLLSTPKFDTNISGISIPFDQSEMIYCNCIIPYTIPFSNFSPNFLTSLILLFLSITLKPCDNITFYCHLLGKVVNLFHSWVNVDVSNALLLLPSISIFLFKLKNSKHLAPLSFKLIFIVSCVSSWIGNQITSSDNFKIFLGSSFNHFDCLKPYFDRFFTLFNSEGLFSFLTSKLINLYFYTSNSYNVDVLFLTTLFYLSCDFLFSSEIQLEQELDLNFKISKIFSQHGDVLQNVLENIFSGFISHQSGFSFLPGKSLLISSSFNFISVIYAYSGYSNLNCLISKLKFLENDKKLFFMAYFFNENLSKSNLIEFDTTRHLFDLLELVVINDLNSSLFFELISLSKNPKLFSINCLNFLTSFLSFLELELDFFKYNNLPDFFLPQSRNSRQNLIDSVKILIKNFPFDVLILDSQSCVLPFLSNFDLKNSLFVPLFLSFYPNSEHLKLIKSNFREDFSRKLINPWFSFIISKSNSLVFNCCNSITSENCEQIIDTLISQIFDSSHHVFEIFTSIICLRLLSKNRFLIPLLISKLFSKLNSINSLETSQKSNVIHPYSIIFDWLIFLFQSNLIDLKLVSWISRQFSFLLSTNSFSINNLDSYLRYFLLLIEFDNFLFKNELFLTMETVNEIFTSKLASFALCFLQNIPNNLPKISNVCVNISLCNSIISYLISKSKLDTPSIPPSSPRASFSTTSNGSITMSKLTALSFLIELISFKMQQTIDFNVKSPVFSEFSVLLPLFAQFNVLLPEIIQHHVPKGHYYVSKFLIESNFSKDLITSSPKYFIILLENFSKISMNNSQAQFVFKLLESSINSLRNLKITDIIRIFSEIFKIKTSIHSFLRNSSIKSDDFDRLFDLLINQIVISFPFTFSFSNSITFIPQLIQFLIHCCNENQVKILVQNFVAACRYDLQFLLHFIMYIRSCDLDPRAQSNLIDLGFSFCSQTDLCSVNSIINFIDQFTILSLELKGVEKTQRQSFLIDRLNSIKEVKGILPKGEEVCGIFPESSIVLKSHAKVPILISFKTPNPVNSVSYIFKAGDDVRHDALALQLIGFIKEILVEAKINFFIQPYMALSTSSSDGVIEVVKNSKSRDQIGGDVDGGLIDWFVQKFGPKNSESFCRAQHRFVQSMIGYSLATLVLAVKDRHNGNILIDNNGHVIHIDFGFIFDISPGGDFRFESAPFKLSREMFDLMGGSITSEPFTLFITEVCKGFLAIRKYSHEIFAIVQLMLNSGLGCFKDGTITSLKERLCYGKSDSEAILIMNSRIKEANCNYRTALYDEFQAWQNNISKPPLLYDIGWKKSPN
ncbi:hypothetical protein RCL1_007769 [Eukaryota sp. TZLM3-RCL]